MKKCTECDLDLIETHEHYVCQHCGLVLNEQIIADDTDEVTEDTKMSSFIPKGSKTYVIHDSKYIYRDIYRLNVQCQYDPKERSNNIVSDNIDNMCSNYSENIASYAKLIFAEIRKSNQIFRGSNLRGIFANAIYYSCMQNNHPTNISELCTNIQMENNVFNKSHTIFKNLIAKTQLKFLLSKKVDVNCYISLLTNNFHKPGLYEKCTFIYNSINNSHNHDIKNIICAIIHIADNTLDIKYICGITNVSSSAVEKIYHNITNLPLPT